MVAAGDLNVARLGGFADRDGQGEHDPGDVSLGHKSVQRWNLPDGWVISKKPAHPALVSEADFVAAQDVSTAPGPAPVGEVSPPERRRYLLAGIVVCGTCGRRMESAWSNGRAAYRCRHGYTTASAPSPGRPRNAYVREDRILLHRLVARHDSPGGSWRSHRCQSTG